MCFGVADSRHGAVQLLSRIFSSNITEGLSAPDTQDISFPSPVTFQLRGMQLYVVLRMELTLPAELCTPTAFLHFLDKFSYKLGWS